MPRVIGLRSKGPSQTGMGHPTRGSFNQRAPLLEGEALKGNSSGPVAPNASSWTLMPQTKEWRVLTVVHLTGASVLPDLRVDARLPGNAWHQWCDEFLVHGVDWRPLRWSGSDLVALLAAHAPIVTTYAGGMPQWRTSNVSTRQQRPAG